MCVLLAEWRIARAQSFVVDAAHPSPLAPSRQFNVQHQSLTPNPQPPVSYTPRHLAERILAEQAAMEARGAFAGERKTITALFTDMQNSMALIEELDPEEARAIIDPMLRLMMGGRPLL